MKNNYNLKGEIIAFNLPQIADNGKVRTGFKSIGVIIDKFEANNAKDSYYLVKEKSGKTHTVNPHQIIGIYTEIDYTNNELNKDICDSNHISKIEYTARNTYNINPVLMVDLYNKYKEFGCTFSDGTLTSIVTLYHSDMDRMKYMDDLDKGIIHVKYFKSYINLMEFYRMEVDLFDIHRLTKLYDEYKETINKTSDVMDGFMSDYNRQLQINNIRETCLKLGVKASPFVELYKYIYDNLNEFKDTDESVIKGLKIGGIFDYNIHEFLPLFDTYNIEIDDYTRREINMIHINSMSIKPIKTSIPIPLNEFDLKYVYRQIRSGCEIKGIASNPFKVLFSILDYEFKNDIFEFKSGEEEVNLHHIYDSLKCGDILTNEYGLYIELFDKYDIFVSDEIIKKMWIPETLTNVKIHNNIRENCRNLGIHYDHFITLHERICEEYARIKVIGDKIPYSKLASFINKGEVLVEHYPTYLYLMRDHYKLIMDMHFIVNMEAKIEYEQDKN